MIVFGLILALLAIAAGVVLFLATQSLTTPVDLEVWGYSWGMTPLALLVAGAVVMLLLWFGLGMMRGSVKRRRRPAREAKEADRQAKIEESIRADERARAEETHRSALADRDRVRDEEFQTRLADRDREREDEFATRQREAEQRIRADERSKVESEIAARSTAAAAAAGGVGATAATDAVATEEVRPEPGRHSADDRVDDATDRVDDGADRADDRVDDAADRSDDAEDSDPDRPGYRTVADKIMGRDPRDDA